MQLIVMMDLSMIAKCRRADARIHRVILFPEDPKYTESFLFASQLSPHYRERLIAHRYREHGHHCLRRQYLSRSGDGGNTRGNVHRIPENIARFLNNITAMYANAHINWMISDSALLFYHFLHGARSVDCCGGTREGTHDFIADGFYQVALIFAHLTDE